jgi:hypothetical protein
VDDTGAPMLLRIQAAVSPPAELPHRHPPSMIGTGVVVGRHTVILVLSCADAAARGRIVARAHTRLPVVAALARLFGEAVAGAPDGGAPRSPRSWYRGGTASASTADQGPHVVADLGITGSWYRLRKRSVHLRAMET